MRNSIHRLGILLGSRSSLSNPVIIGFTLVGFLITLFFLWRTSGQPILISALASAGVSLFSTGTLLLARALGNRDDWNHAHPLIVLGGMISASIVRSVLTIPYMMWSSRGVGEVSPSASRTLAGIILSVTLGAVIAASVTLAQERVEINHAFLLEQARLRELAESADLELSRAEIELRTRARDLLEPTIEEIKDLISGEISASAAQLVSVRINAAVNEVVRPASHELARSSYSESHVSSVLVTGSPSLLKDYVDITETIRPWWLLLFSIPGALAIGPQLSIFLQLLALSLVTVLLLLLVRLAWPRRYRRLQVSVGLLALLAIYSAVILGFNLLISHVGSSAIASILWTPVNLVGSLSRIAIMMLVSIAAIFRIHSEQFRASLLETNARLEALIARIKRETWLMHRSVSLSVHGTLQSALISTSMRLSAEDRTSETVADARRRLEAALESVVANQGECAPLEEALTELQALWHPLVALDFVISSGAHDRLSADAGLRSCVTEICREGVSNAIRHGKATIVDIRISTDGDLIEIRICDNGDGPPDGALAGLGSQMLDETCIRWKLGQRPEGGSDLIALLA